MLLIQIGQCKAYRPEEPKAYNHCTKSCTAMANELYIQLKFQLYRVRSNEQIDKSYEIELIAEEGTKEEVEATLTLIHIYPNPVYLIWNLSTKDIKVNIQEGSFPFHMIKYEARRIIKRAMHKSGEMGSNSEK